MIVELQGPRADRLRVEGRHKEKARRRPHFLVVGRDAPGGIEAGVEPPVELGEGLPQAMARAWVCGIDRGDLDHRCDSPVHSLTVVSSPKTVENQPTAGIPGPPAPISHVPVQEEDKPRQWGLGPGLQCPPSPLHYSIYLVSWPRPAPPGCAVVWTFT